MKQLKLSIKPKQEPTEGQSLNSSGYSVKINDWELGRGVTDFKLEMPADKNQKSLSQQFQMLLKLMAWLWILKF